MDIDRKLPDLIWNAGAGGIVVQGGLECRGAEGRETEVQNCQELVTLWMRSLANVEDTSLSQVTQAVVLPFA